MSDDPLIDGRPISDFKVVELKKELEARDLPKSGNKKDLYERLKEYMLANEAPVAAGGDGGGGEAVAAGGGGRGKSQSPVKSPAKEQPVNPMVARYLATQEQALKAAQHNADLIRGASSEESEADSSPQRRRSTRVSESSDKAMTTESPIHPRAAEEPQKHTNGDAPPPQTDVAAPQVPQSDKENTSEELAEEPTKTATAASEEEQSEDAKTDAGEDAALADEESLTEERGVVAEEEQKEPDMAVPEPEAHPTANGHAGKSSRDEEAGPEKEPSTDRSSEAKEANEPSEEASQRRRRSATPESGKESSPPKALPHDEKERTPSPQSDDIAQKIADRQPSLSPASEKDERVEKKDERDEGGVIAGVDEDDELDEEKEPERSETPEAHVDKEEEKEPVDQHQPEVQEVKKPLVSKRLLKTGEEELTLDYDEESPANKAARTEPQVYTEGVVVVNDPSKKLDYGKAKEEESTITSEGLNRTRALSPARNPVSQYIHIIGLKRPFTNGQLQNLITFWIDKVKSNCIVKYATEEQAERAREGLHNVKWPQGNEETLKVEFASEERLIRRREENKPKEEEDLSLRVTVENDKVTRDSAGAVGDRRDSERRRVSTDVREERERAREPAPPTKDLAELFRKTTAQPFIYWLPLTEEEAEQRRAQKAAEKPRSEKRDSDRDRHRDDRRRSERSPERKRLRNDSPPRRRR
ncbi:hypothetical protein AAVH_10973 [Aphelenchoides avenae]|nr:hypothetical protein AAVH_10973 [Aphelenchus avenae]